MSEHEVAIIKDLAETVSQLDSINKKLLLAYGNGLAAGAALEGKKMAKNDESDE